MFSPKKTGMDRVRVITDKFKEMISEIEQGIIEMIEDRKDLKSKIESLEVEVYAIDNNMSEAQFSLDRLKRIVEE
jgi:Mg2+ and Co2+ transporter CorA